jgi:hypothetical protein
MRNKLETPPARELLQYATATLPGAAKWFSDTENRDKLQPLLALHEGNQCVGFIFSSA